MTVFINHSLLMIVGIFLIHQVTKWKLCYFVKDRLTWCKFVPSHSDTMSEWAGPTYVGLSYLYINTRFILRLSNFDGENGNSRFVKYKHDIWPNIVRTARLNVGMSILINSKCDNKTNVLMYPTRHMSVCYPLGNISIPVLF